MSALDAGAALPRAKAGHPAGADAASGRARRRAVHRLALDVRDPDRGGARDGDDDLHHGFGPHPGLWHDGRAQLRPWRLHCAGRLCRDPGADAAGELVERQFAFPEPRGLRPRGHRRGADLRRLRLGVRAPDRQTRLRPALEADSGDHRRFDHRRAIALRRVRPGADSAQRPEDSRGLVRHWPGGDREISGAGDMRRPPGVLRRDAGPQSDQDRPPDPRRGREPRDGRGARLSSSTGCSWRCSWRARRLRDWAAR